jgi:Putative prokaryotic signal transducing protein
MIEVLRTNNAVRLNYAVVLLERAGCEPFVADRFIASAEGGISAFERRILVPDELEARAKVALKELDTPPPPETDDDDSWDGDPA